MGMFLAKETINRGVTIFQKVHETAQGGFTLDNTGLVAKSTLLAGTVMGYDESTRMAVVIKSAVLQADATNTATTYQVKKGHTFAVGNYLAATTGAKAYAITAIDTSNGAYDVLTVGTTLGVALTAGTALFQSATTGASNSSFFVTPKGLLFEDVDVYPHASVSVVVRGTVYARRIPGVVDSIKSALPLIIFSQSY